MDRQPAPDFTTAFLVSISPLVFIALTAIWIVGGLFSAGLASYAADKGINWIGRMRNRA